MRVCIIAPNFLEPTAWMVSAYKTALMLQEAGHSVSVLTTRTKGSKSKETIEGVRVYRLPSMFIPDPFNYTIAKGLSDGLEMIDEKEKPQVYIISKYMFYTSLAAFELKKKGKRVIVQTDTFPGINWFAPSKILNAGMWMYSRTIGKAILKKADLVVLLHERLLPTPNKLGIKYRVIHNGIDMKKYSKAKPDLELLDYKKDYPLITYVGRLDDVKGYQLFIRMTDRLYSQGVHARFLMVVGNKNEELRKKLAREHPHIRFESFREDIPEIWKASDIGVLPSYAEGLPNTVMEAMAAGVPMVAADVGGVGAIITHREDGLLFAKGDIRGMTRDVMEMIHHKKLVTRLGKAATKKIKRSFDLAKIKKEWNEVLCAE